MQIIEMAVKDLKPYEKNPRKNDEAVKGIKTVETENSALHHER